MFRSYLCDEFIWMLIVYMLKNKWQLIPPPPSGSDLPSEVKICVNTRFSVDKTTSGASSDRRTYPTWHRRRNHSFLETYCKEYRNKCYSFTFCLKILRKERTIELYKKSINYRLKEKCSSFLQFVQIITRIFINNIQGGPKSFKNIQNEFI